MSDNNGTPDGLSHDDADDCIDHIECISGIHLTRDQLQVVLDRRLMAEISEWGVDDTEVGGRIANAVSLHLLDQPWPLNGDDANINAFVSELRAAAGKRGYQLVESSDSETPPLQSQATSVDEPSGITHAIVVGGEPPSLLERLTPQERAALFSWSREQKTASPGGSTDLMAWPGWGDALYRAQADSTAAWGTALDVIDRIKANSAK